MNQGAALKQDETQTWAIQHTSQTSDIKVASAIANWSAPTA